MFEAPNHLIHKVFLDITVKNKEQAYTIKDNISAFLAKEVFPELELYLLQLQEETKQFAIRLEDVRLDLSVQQLNLNTNLKHDIIKAFKQQIKASFTDVINKVKPEKASPYFFTREQHQLATLTYFIEHGTAPWWQPKDSITQMLEANFLKPLVSEPMFKIQLLRLLSNKLVIQRLVRQFSIDSLLIILQIFVTDVYTQKKIETSFFQKIDLYSIKQRDIFLTAIFEVVVKEEKLTESNTIEILTALKVDASKDKVVKDSIVTDITESTVITGLEAETEEVDENQNVTIKEKSREEGKEVTLKETEIPINEKRRKEDELIQFKNNTFEKSEGNYFIAEKEIHLKNAGLVLLHPFLYHLFKHCDLIDEEKNIVQPELAVHILHYLATGNTQQAESDLLFEKFLCNIPFEVPISRFVVISDAHKEHVHKLLDAVKQNWSAMSKSSYGLIRNEFLQRNGKLEFKNNSATVTVERKTHDILLNKLSWGISMVRLPWKKGFLYVNWS